MDNTTLHTFLLYVYPASPLHFLQTVIHQQALATAQLLYAVLFYLVLGTTSQHHIHSRLTRAEAGGSGRAALPFETSFATETWITYLPKETDCSKWEARIGTM